MIEWKSAKSEDLWYLVGLLTSDGCLSGDGRHVILTAKDEMFLEKVRLRLRISNPVTMTRGGVGSLCHRLQIGGVDFYRFLRSIGLTPRKSLTLGSLRVPRIYFLDFLRGIIDGDGSIRSWIHPTNGGSQWSLRIYSGSVNFLLWLKDEIDLILSSRGKIHRNNKTEHVLKYGKMAAQDILKRCYYDGCLGLDRKENLASQCVGSVRGWGRSKTVGQVAKPADATDSERVSLGVTSG